MKILALCLGISTGIAAQEPIYEQVEVIKEGVMTIKIYPDSIITDTMSMEEYIRIPVKASKNDLEQRNRQLRQLMKEPD